MTTRARMIPVRLVTLKALRRYLRGIAAAGPLDRIGGRQVGARVFLRELPTTKRTPGNGGGRP